MNDSARAARDDLAFLRAVSEDRGPLPALLGAHLIALGAVIAASFVLVWAVFAGRLAWPANLAWAAWIPCAAAYLPVNLYLHYRGRGQPWGPSARAVLTAWAAMAVMIAPAVAVLMIASWRTGLAMYESWPALAFVLYGGAWFSGGIVRREGWHVGVALACFAVAASSAALIGSTAYWLAQAVGAVLLIAMPGAFIMWRARQA